jgi:hypothetical protein
LELDAVVRTGRRSRGSEVVKPKQQRAKRWHGHVKSKRRDLDFKPDPVWHLLADLASNISSARSVQ